MATQLKVTEDSRRSKKFAPPQNHKEYPHTPTSRDSGSRKTVMPMKSHMVWSDRLSPDKQQGLSSTSSSLKKWQEELFF